MKISKLTRSAFLILGFVSFSGYSVADCYPVGESKVTPDYHCESGCGGHAENVPAQEICVKTAANRYLKDGKIECVGLNPCQYMTHGKPFNKDDGSTMCYSFKTWSKPVTIQISATSCPK